MSRVFWGAAACVASAAATSVVEDTGSGRWSTDLPRRSLQGVFDKPGMRDIGIEDLMPKIGRTHD
jgi:hypothetical protein